MKFIAGYHLIAAIPMKFKLSAVHWASKIVHLVIIWTWSFLIRVHFLELNYFVQDLKRHFLGSFWH